MDILGRQEQGPPLRLVLGSMQMWFCAPSRSMCSHTMPMLLPFVHEMLEVAHGEYWAVNLIPGPHQNCFWHMHADLQRLDRGGFLSFGVAGYFIDGGVGGWVFPPSFMVQS